MNWFIRFLLWVGFVSLDVRENEQRLPKKVVVVWPFHFSGWEHFWFLLRHSDGKTFKRFYVFRNLPHVIKWRNGRLLPRRLGFGFCGIEFGDRGH